MGLYGSHDFSFCRDLFRNSIFRCILVAPWLTVGTLGPQSGSLLAPLGSPLAPFGSLLALFSFLWLTFGTLFEEIMKTFINSVHFHEFAHNSKENIQQPDPRATHPLLDPPLPLAWSGTLP